MTLSGVFDSGQPCTVIMNLYYDNSDIYCFILIPPCTVKRQINRAWLYDANNIGSITCVAPYRRQINLELDGKRN